MANVLSAEKQTAMIGALKEGSSIRSMLHVGPIKSPLLAVRAAIVQEFRENAATEKN